MSEALYEALREIDDLERFICPTQAATYAIYNDSGKKWVRGGEAEEMKRQPVISFASVLDAVSQILYVLEDDEGLIYLVKPYPKDE